MDQLERLLSAGEGLEPDDLAVAQLEDVHPLVAEVGAAALAAAVVGPTTTT